MNDAIPHARQSEYHGVDLNSRKLAVMVLAAQEMDQEGLARHFRTREEFVIRTARLARERRWPLAGVEDHDLKRKDKGGGPRHQELRDIYNHSRFGLAPGESRAARKCAEHEQDGRDGREAALRARCTVLEAKNAELVQKVSDLAAELNRQDETAKIAAVKEKMKKLEMSFQRKEPRIARRSPKVAAAGSDGLKRLQARERPGHMAPSRHA